MLMGNITAVQIIDIVNNFINTELLQPLHPPAFSGI